MNKRYDYTINGINKNDKIILKKYIPSLYIYVYLIQVDSDSGYTLNQLLALLEARIHISGIYLNIFNFVKEYEYILLRNDKINNLVSG